jgi:integrase
MLHPFELNGGFDMGTAQPIRNEKELEAFRKYYLEQKQNYRNYALICLGVNSALRISDILKLKWSDVYDAKKRCFRKHIIITEKKTGKENRIAINSNTKMGLQMYLNSLHYFDVDEYIFAGQKEHSHLCRSQAFRIVKQAAQSLNMEDRISCHSMRKTFGYYAWKFGTQPAVLMDIYNHSSYEITKRYLGIKQDDKDSVFLNVNL